MDNPQDVVGRVGAVLRAVAAHEPGGSNTAVVARGAALPRPTAHRLLHSLQGEGLVDRDPASGRWLLGPELHFLGIAAAPRYDITLAAQPVVRRLASLTGESAFLSTRRGDETICLLREDGSFPIRSHVLSEGVRFPLGVASAGMVLLAHLSDHDVEDYLARCDLTATYGATHAAHELRDHLMRTRSTGYAVNPGLVVEGSWGMAAAVFDVDGRARWALSLTGVAHRFHHSRHAELGALLMREAHTLTRLVGRQGRTATP